MKIETLDIALFAIYVIALIGIAWWVSREEKGHEKDTNDYFLAGSSLPWWAIGASLIAANISAEQIIGMSGSGYMVGLAIASYEWMAAITLIIVGKYFLPIFLKHKIYTMPQFLEQRYDHRVRMVMAVFWLGVYVFVNLTAVLWLGALAINTIAGVDLMYGMIFLGVFSLAYSLYGGLKAVAMTDIIQVVLLVLGGMFLSYTALNIIGDGAGFWAGFNTVTTELPGKFDMILSEDNPHYMDLPGLSVLIGGMWIMNLSYWGFNQYIIQRTLAAKSVNEAQKGIVFAAFLKVLMPLIVVLPGIAAVLLVPDLEKADQAYPSLMTLMPVGLKGIIFAALVAAIVSSLASMTNSVSTIFTMDIYKDRNPDKSQHHYVKVGRIVSLLALIIAMVVAKPLLGQFDQAFQYIQEFTGFFTPGIVALFALGMFWKKTTANGGLVAAVGSAVFSLAFKLLLPELPFMDRVGIVFLLCVGLAVIVSLFEGKGDHEHAVQLNDINFKTSSVFNVGSVALTIVVAAFYITWW
ncbi:MAG: sodium/sugar symporter [Pseudomonadota bacterium]|uniref:Sodium transporter n=1 Tax=Alteromonas alba TaxID=2079529 RepID=A0A2S9VDS2_9ALTE|nr:sodium/sugar symporter [Alteromonas alba]MDY6927805.1 sodium/sugar symporter [Pseudomonadota bacterium]PRO74574.1 sodium transporter [Alteromonas alba]|tara:strand:+ start:19412 stop:20974 length:1563 start_codon:yes stop_codon:yes gene_type:complete